MGLVAILQSYSASPIILMENTLNICSFAYVPTRLKWLLEEPLIVPIADVPKVGLLDAEVHQNRWCRAMKIGGFFCTTSYPNDRVVDGAKQWKPRYVLTEYISEPSTLDYMLPLLEEASYHVQNDIVVCCTRPEVALRVPDQYIVGVSGKESQDVFDPCILLAGVYG